jgi:DNA replication and repair protein RecF
LPRLDVPRRAAIENLRCVESAALEFSPELNLIAGENGAGKTSILEAIFLLGAGVLPDAQQRAAYPHHQPSSPFRPTDDSPPKRRGVEIARMAAPRQDQRRERSLLLELTAFCRCRHRSRDSQARGPGPERAARGWTGWCSTWNQPLAALGSIQPGAQAAERGAEERARGVSCLGCELIRNGERITEARQRRSSDWSRASRNLSSASGSGRRSGFTPAGWRDVLRGALATHAERDRAAGHDRGPHRADVTLRRIHRVARETLSRGQQKLTAVAMIIAQLRLLHDELNLRAVLLLDDPAAELDDKESRAIV